MVYDGAKDGYKLSFGFVCPACQKAGIRFETRCIKGEMEATLTKRVKLKCPSCGNEAVFNCGAAEEIEMVKA